MDLENINKSIDALGKSVDELKKAQDQSKSDGDTLVQQKLDNIANDVATKLEAVQTQQQKFAAFMERAGTAANDNEKPEDKEAKAAFSKLLRKGDKHLTEAELKAMSTDSNPDGGYMVPTQMLGVVNGRVFETSPLRRVATVISTSNKSVEMILDDQEAGFGWAGEGDAISETDTPKLGKLEIVAHKAFAYPKVTTEMIQDAAFDVEAWLASKMSDKFARGENTAFVNGDGVGRPRGFLTYAAGSSTYARDQIEQVNNGSTSATTENGLLTLQGSLKEAYQARAAWAMKRTTFVDVMKVAGSNSFRFLNLASASAPASQVLPSNLLLLEKPVVMMDDMPQIASAALGIAYGDFGAGYMIVDRVGISVQADPYTTPGVVKYYATKRVGGGVTNFEAIKLLKYS